MLLAGLDKRIRSAFSNAALEYELLTSLHKEIGRELAKKVIEAPDLESILDVGMGTGWLTRRIKFFLPESLVVGIDLADGMLRQARVKDDHQLLLQANAATLPFKEASFDLIISNLSLQWVKPLERCFFGAHRCLKKDGRFLFTMFGRRTFEELFDSLDAARQQFNGERFIVERLRTQEQVGELLAGCGFRDIKLDHERIKVNFTDMASLVKWIKDIGANALPREVFVGKQLLEKADAHYEKNFKDKFGIYATFEVIWAQAQK
jgi:malonyl-CoA O-methyltransferase